MMMSDLTENPRDLRSTLGSAELDWLSVVIWCLVALVGVLQAKRIDAGWLTSYGGDVFGPAVLWWTV